MQRKLTEGYKKYGNAMKSNKYMVDISPVGQAYEMIFDEIIRSGKDPLNPNSIFYKLYISDGSHQSLRGSYLASCIFYVKIHKKSTIGIQFQPGDLTKEEILFFQNISEKFLNK
jgi:hypothetical protein